MNVYDLILDDCYLPKLQKVKELENTHKILEIEDLVEFCNKNLNLNNLAQEHVYLFGFNSDQDITGVFLINKGSSEQSMVSKREIFISLLLTGSSRFILLHNHPGSDLGISDADKKITSQLKFMASILEVDFLDHIIITRNGYFSMAQETDLI